MRIIAGRHKGRKIEVLPDKNVRPTSGKAREAIFSILTNARFLDGESAVEEKCVADIFSGSGAMAFEALSRGAAHAVLVDKNPENLKLARSLAERFGERAQTDFLRADASNLPKAKRPCELVFLDPPYHSGLGLPALKSLAAQGWLQEDAIIVLELATREDMTLPEGFELMDERRYGAAKVLILKRAAG